MKLKIIYYLILLITTQYKCEISPIVITPKIFGLNSNQNIVIISDKSQSIDVSLQDFNTKQLIFNKKYDVLKDEPLRVPLDVRNISSLTETKVKLSVISGSKQKSESLIKLIPKYGFAFIQTDKPIYSPKENVLIRMIRLDDRLRPLNQKVKLRIKNTQKIIIEEKSLNPTQPNYFIDHTFEFPPSPKLGIWFAELWYGTNFSSNSTVSFEVKEYVLPTFSIKINSPKFILESSRQISGSVWVEYVYGKPVDGTAVFKFGTKEPNGRILYFGSTSIKHLVNGSAHYNVDTTQFRQNPLSWFPVFDRHRFVVEVSVHERATGKKDRALDESGLFVSSPYVISFKNTFSDFKPNVEIFITAQILNVLGETVPDLRVKLSLNDQSGRVILHNNYSNITSTQLVSDGWGRISFPVILEDSITELHVLIRTDDPNISPSEQAEAEHVLYVYQPTNGFIHISSKSKYSTSLSVGNTYRSPIVIRGPISQDQIYAIVTNRGDIIYSERVLADRGIKIEITQEMTPSIRILVLGIFRNGDLTSDNIKIDVSEDKCGFDMSIENDIKQVFPGKTLNLYLNGSRGDSVALMGVDEAVYIHRNEEKLTKSKLMKELSKSDLGCGPGSGSDLKVNANNAGLKIITSNSDMNEDFSDDHCLRRQPNNRFKRDTKHITNLNQRFQRKCCILGILPSNIWRSCSDKASIIKDFMPDNSLCVNAFLHCCQYFRIDEPFLMFPVFGDGQNIKVDRNSFPIFPLVYRSPPGEYIHIAFEEDLEVKIYVRKDFRESWLFDVVVLNQSSNVYPVTVPDSITTWSLIGMSISPLNGLCIMSSPLRLRTFQDIFIQVSLPYSVVQNEQIEMVVTIFNYGSIPRPVLVFTYGIEDICSEAESVGMKIKKYLLVESNSFSTAVYPMVPIRTGTFEIKVVALWTFLILGGDTIVKKLNVIPPGITIEEELTFKLDPNNRQRRSERSIKTTKIEDEIISENSIQKTVVNVEPDVIRNIVPGTRECIIAAIGDEYGATTYTTLNDIDRLIRQPKGCGEQTMFYMAPTLYTLKYLDSIDRLNGDLKYRGLKYIRNGYKRILSFRKDDGSFSAFSTRPSSIWLTSFIMKVLCQSYLYLKDDKLDPNVIKKGIEWLMDEQKKDGSWTEKHAVIHENALGGVKGVIPLTAYVLIAFHECVDISVFENELKNDRNYSNNLKKSLERSESYLKVTQNETIRQKNTYAMALVAYSLTKTDPLNANKLVDALHSNANVDNNRNYKFWGHEYEVETTSYALMAILGSGNKRSLDCLSISNWLNSVRSFSGSFASTQDTIVALEALFKYIETQKNPSLDISLLCNITSHKMTSSRFRRALAFTPENAQILQTFKLDLDFSKLIFTTTGEGMGHMLVKLKYNVFEPPEVLCRFDLTVDIKEWKAQPEPRDSDNRFEFDDSFFNDFNADMIQKLNLSLPKRQKGLEFWGFSNERSGPSAETDRNGRLDNKSGITDDYTFKKNNLSSNSISNSVGKSRLVLLLETCIRHIPRYYPDMSLIEIGLLSGYKVNKDDLDEIIQMEGSLVSKYEISERNIVFYFEKVPFDKPYCIQFRKIQEHSIGNTQAAIIKVYDYYHKDHSCSQLYTPSRLSGYIETKCTSEVCECAKRENCPISKPLIEIGNIAEKRIQRARQLLEDLVCLKKFNYVFSASFESQNITQNKFKFFQLKVNSVFKGNLKNNNKFGLSLNPECKHSSLTEGRDNIIFGHFNEKDGHLNGSSIVYDVTDDLRTDETRTGILRLFKYLENKIKREDWSCFDNYFENF